MSLVSNIVAVGHANGVAEEAMRKRSLALAPLVLLRDALDELVADAQRGLSECELKPTEALALEDFGVKVQRRQNPEEKGSCQFFVVFKEAE